MQLWKHFLQRQKLLEQWIDEAKTIVSEKNDDRTYLIQKHEQFFRMVDDEILHGFIESGEQLLHIRDPIEQKDIKHLMSTLESSWRMIVCCAPIRLLRLHYERIELIIVNELKQADEELDDELKQLERHRDTSHLLQRHNDFFQPNKFHPAVETHIRELQNYAHNIRSQEREQNATKPENEHIDQQTNKLNDYWKKMQSKIDNVRRKLQTIPKKWDEYERRSVRQE